MSITSDIADLQSWVLTCGVPRKRLSREAGLSGQTLRHAGRSGWNPSAETLKKLEALRSRMAGDGHRGTARSDGEGLTV